MDRPNGGSVHQKSSNRRYLRRDRERPRELPSKQLSEQTTISEVCDVRTSANLVANVRSEINRFTELLADYVELTDRRVVNIQEPPAGTFSGGSLEDKIQYYENRSIRCTRAYETFMKSRKRNINTTRMIFPGDDFSQGYFRRKEEMMKAKMEAEEECKKLNEYIVNIRKSNIGRDSNTMEKVDYPQSDEDPEALVTTTRSRRQQRVGKLNEDGSRSISGHSAGDRLNQSHPSCRSTITSCESHNTPATDGDNNNNTGGLNHQESTRPRRRWRIRYRWLRRVWRWARKHRWRNNRSILVTDNQ